MKTHEPSANSMFNYTIRPEPSAFWIVVQIYNKCSQCDSIVKKNGEKDEKSQSTLKKKKEKITKPFLS